MARGRLSRERDQFLEETSWDVSFVGNWTYERGKMFHKGGLMRTEEIGASVVATFWGTGIKLLGSLGWNHSQLAISLDGGNDTVFDAFCCPPTGSIQQVVQFQVAGLSRGAHVLNVTNLVAGPHGSVLDVDAFIVTPPPIHVVELSILSSALILALGWMFWMRKRAGAKEKTREEEHNVYQMLPTGSVHVLGDGEEDEDDENESV
ncbi:hypothetical protein MKEN_00712000 [Mycena kentingensis (nom. inval.)]|nr:hypothetical protein MKEN_00712000 [Mycena kentingensis (nom. inval.)]